MLINGASRCEKTPMGSKTPWRVTLWPRLLRLPHKIDPKSAIADRNQLATLNAPSRRNSADRRRHPCASMDARALVSKHEGLFHQILLS